ASASVPKAGVDLAPSQSSFSWHSGPPSSRPSGEWQDLLQPIAVVPRPGKPVDRARRDCVTSVRQGAWMNRKDRRAARKPGTAAGPGPGDQALFATAVRQHQAGQLADAEQLYHAVLAVAPKHPQSLYLLGLVALQSGRAPAGI